jgi:hypothetical protein
MKTSRFFKILFVVLLLHAPVAAQGVTPARLVTAEVSIVDAKGFPIENGEYTWKSVDGLSKSSKKILGTALGVVALNSIPTKEVELTINHGKAADGLCLAGKLRFTPQSGKTKLVLPNFEKPVDRIIRVELPGGQPVPNAIVNSQNLLGAYMSEANITGDAFRGNISGSMKVAPGQPSFRCQDFNTGNSAEWHGAWNQWFDGKRQDAVTLKGVTNANGQVVLKGWPRLPYMRGECDFRGNCVNDPRPPFPIEVQAIFDDGVLYQKTAWAETNQNGVTKLKLDYFPILKTSSDNIDAYMNELVSLPVSVVDSADLEPMSFSRFISEPRASRSSFVGKPSAAFAGVQVEVVAPAGSKAAKCTKKQTLKTKTSSSGKALLKVCVTTSGNYQIKGKGAVSMGKVSIHVKGAAPMAPTALSTRAAAKRATVAWGLPTYSGGTPILKYVVTATSSGQKAKKIEVKANTAAFKSRKLYLTGLAAPKNWQVSVVAVTKYGEGEKASVFVNVPNK